MKDIFYLILIVILVIVFKSYDNELKEYGDGSDKFLKEIVINNNRYVIVDYDFINREYTLDNGVKVNRVVVDTLLN